MKSDPAPLKRPIFFDPLVTVLTGFHCNIVFPPNSSITMLSLKVSRIGRIGIAACRNGGCDIKPGNEKEKKQNILVVF